MTEELKQKAKEYGFLHMRLVDDHYNTFDDIEQAYIAGATENDIQWHDLRKDPNDLPKEDYEVFAYYEKGSLCSKAKLEKYKKGVLWVGSGEISLWVNGLGYQIRDVIAWCEIPQFKE